MSDGIIEIDIEDLADLQESIKEIGKVNIELRQKLAEKTWIPVSERLPEYPCECLVVSEYRGDIRVLICEWNDGWRTVSWVKYWMLKPLPPEIMK